MLKNKIALITGASRGIGRELAVRFSSEGILVAITGRDEKELNTTADEVRKNGKEALLILADQKDKKSPGQIISQVIGKYGALDILINNAGFAINKPFEKHTTDEWDDLIAINARAPFFITQAALPYLKKSSIPTVINISSAVGRLGYPDQSAYTASKHALMGWTKSLAKEVQKDGIRVHVIAPGGVATDMIAKMRPDIKKEELIQTKEIADVVMFLLSMKGNAMIDEINLRRFSAAPWQ